MVQLHRGSTAEAIRERAAVIGAEREAGANFQSAVLEHLHAVGVKFFRIRSPTQRKLLQDRSKKLGIHDAPWISNMPPDLRQPTADPLPGVGVHFDVDWDNVDAFMRVLQTCQVAQ